MQKKRTPTKPQKPRKIAPKPECWPYQHDYIDPMWAREAIRYGNAATLAQYHVSPFVNKRFGDGDLARVATDLSYLFPSAAPNKTASLKRRVPSSRPKGGQLPPYSRNTNLEGDRKC